MNADTRMYRKYNKNAKDARLARSRGDTYALAFQLLTEKRRNSQATSGALQSAGLTAKEMGIPSSNANISTEQLIGNRSSVNFSKTMHSHQSDTLQPPSLADNVLSRSHKKSNGTWYYEKVDPNSKPEDTAASSPSRPKRRIIPTEKSATMSTLRKPTRFVCNTCDRRFLTNHHLGRHELLHTGEKAFECLDCKIKFARSDYLLRHQRTAQHRTQIKRSSQAPLVAPLHRQRDTPSAESRSELPRMTREAAINFAAPLSFNVHATISASPSQTTQHTTATSLRNLNNPSQTIPTAIIISPNSQSQISTSSAQISTSQFMAGTKRVAASSPANLLSRRPPKKQKLNPLWPEDDSDSDIELEEPRLYFSSDED